jgi:hypothetical protein
MQRIIRLVQRTGRPGRDQAPCQVRLTALDEPSYQFGLDGCQVGHEMLAAVSAAARAGQPRGRRENGHGLVQLSIQAAKLIQHALVHRLLDGVSGPACQGAS